MRKAFSSKMQLNCAVLLEAGPFHLWGSADFMSRKIAGEFFGTHSSRSSRIGRERLLDVLNDSNGRDVL